MQQALGTLDGAIVGLLGDPASIRSFRSIVLGLSLFPVQKITFLLPPECPLSNETTSVLAARGIRWGLCSDIREMLAEVDVIETIGIRHPHHTWYGETLVKDRTPALYRLDHQTIKSVNRFIPILHPGPRTDEIDPDVDGLANAWYFKQAANGMWLRMALLATTLFQPEHW